MFLNDAYKSDFKRFGQMYMAWQSKESLECLEMLNSEGNSTPAEPSKKAEDDEWRDDKSDSENERYNDMVYQNTIKKMETCQKDIDVNSLIGNLNKLKARSNRSESQPGDQPRSLSNNFVRSVRSMSPVRSCAPGSISFEFENKSSPELSLGQVDELDNFTKRPRSNSNEGLMSKPLSRSNSKDKKRSSSSGRE